MGVLNNQYHYYLATVYLIIILVCCSPFPNSQDRGSIIARVSAQDNTTQGYTAFVNFRFITLRPVVFASTRLSIYKVIVARPQDYSLGKVGIASVGLLDDTVRASMEAGYIVYPERYGDNITRFYVRWKNIANGITTGCFDDDCPGFVRNETFGGYLGFNLASADPGTGASFAPTYGLRISQNRTSKNWVVELDGAPVGYWPNELFTGAVSGFNVADIGGEVYDSTGDTSPKTQMGSGQFPEAINDRGAFFKDTTVADEANHLLRVGNLVNSAFRPRFSNPTCYGADFADHLTRVTGEPLLLYGGPGCM